MTIKFLPLRILVLASLVVLTLFLWQGNTGFDLGDEGFLWYGVERVLLGEVPIRDFMAYDPGRYYWSAALMTLWGDNGLLSLRGAVAVFQTIGLFVGLILIIHGEKKPNFPYLVLSAITLVVWMYPRCKHFDISLSILLIAVLAFLIVNPSRRRFFFAGFCVGLIAVFGRNHGVYGFMGGIGVMAWLRIRRAQSPSLFEKFMLFTSGAVTGFMPVLLMVLLVPGFAIAFWESIRFLFEVRTTNYPLPVPWPWRVDFASASAIEAIRGVLVGLFFIGIVVFGFLAIVWVVLQKIRNNPVSPVLVSASFLALPYAHYAYSRADVAHLALGIFPSLVGCLVLLAPHDAKVKWPLAIMLCAASLVVMHKLHPGWRCNVRKDCANIAISGDEIAVEDKTAREIVLLRVLAAQYAPDGQSFLATPLWPGAYPLLERGSPMWEIYALFPRPRAFEEAEIERIRAARPGFVLVLDLALDGRDELRFRNTHPLIHQYIVDHFERLPESPNLAYQIYRAKRNME